MPTVCVFVLLAFSPFKGGRTCALSSACKTNRAHFTDWMSFLPSNLNSKREALRENTESLSSQ